MHETLRSYLTEHSPQGGNASFSNDESLLEAGIIDSMSMIELIEFIERSYEIQVDEDDMTPENFDNINAMVDFIERSKAS